MQHSKTYFYIKRIIICALLVALGVVFSRLLSVPITNVGIYSLNLGFGMLPILLLAILYGPLWGLLGAVAWDLIGALLFPNGGFNPLFTLTAATLGLVVGLFYAKKRPVTIGRTFLACFAGQLVYSVILNTLLLVFIYSAPFVITLTTRAIENAIMIVINTLLLSMITDTLRNYKLLPERFGEEITTDAVVKTESDDTNKEKVK